MTKASSFPWKVLFSSIWEAFAQRQGACLRSQGDFSLFLWLGEVGGGWRGRESHGCLRSSSYRGHCPNVRPKGCLQIYSCFLFLYQILLCVAKSKSKTCRPALLGALIEWPFLVVRGFHREPVTSGSKEKRIMWPSFGLMTCFWPKPNFLKSQNLTRSPKRSPIKGGWVEVLLTWISHRVVLVEGHPKSCDQISAKWPSDPDLYFLNSAQFFFTASPRWRWGWSAWIQERSTAKDGWFLVGVLLLGRASRVHDCMIKLSWLKRREEEFTWL